jgi:hypothetical protein
VQFGGRPGITDVEAAAVLAFDVPLPAAGVPVRHQHRWRPAIDVPLCQPGPNAFALAGQFARYRLADRPACRTLFPIRQKSRPIIRSSRMRRSEVCFALVTALMFARAGVSHAQGYGVYEQGACTMGRGGTAAARPCADGSGMYFNPAGIAGLPLSGSIGGALIWPGTKWRNDDTQIDASFLSKTYATNLCFVAPVAGAMRWPQVSMSYGLTTEWDKESFEGPLARL